MAGGNPACGVVPQAKASILLTVTDTPYPELVAAARAIHRQTYQQRSGRE